MSVNELIPGDLLWREKSGVWHLGIYWGSGQVLHNSPAIGECITAFPIFANGKPVHVARPNPQSRTAIIQRAGQIVANPKPYSYLWRNCEHTAYEIMEGESHSPTVGKLLALTASVGLCYLAFRYRK